MAIVCIFDNPNTSTELYDRVSASLGDEAPAGAIFHAACLRDGGGLFMVEAWESEEALQKWTEHLNTKIQAAGGPPRVQPKTYKAHKIRMNKAT